ncbi:MAG: homoaconitate hydratase family protein [Caldilineae bacterium]|nr:MAG: homoaconitate hydratase family protein [Caldilineae bacterium]
MTAFTFAQKAIARAAGLPQVDIGTVVEVEPDRALSHDNSAAIMRIFADTGAKRVRYPERLAITLDHAAPPPTTRHAQNHAEIRRFVREQGIRHFFEIGRGICHQVLSEEALVLPGQLILGADSHTPHFGWMGAFGAGVGRSEMAAIWATGRLWLRVPETLSIELRGSLPEGVTAKDLALHILGRFGADGGTYLSVEFAGEGVASLDVAQRMTLANMMAEFGVKNAYLPPDEKVFHWLAVRYARRTGVGPEEALAQVQKDALYPDAAAPVVARHVVVLDELEPLVACPHRPDHVLPLSAVSGREVHQAFIGTCTNGRLEDLAAAAAVLRRTDGSTRHITVPLIVIPASRTVLQEAVAAGYVQTFLEAGAVLGTPGCGPCMGNHFGIPAPGEVVISTANRNYRGRMGTRESEVYLSSPAVVAASAVTGRITHPAELEAG